APTRPEQHPGAAADAAVLALPGLEPRWREQKIGITLDVGGHVDHARRTHEARGGNRVARVPGQILAGDPMNRRVEVRTRMLAEAQRVPVPRRTFVVVPRDGVDG